jgi:guanylate cyclase
MDEFDGLSLRAGISSGPVIAGVIGKRRLVYDLWGDTVNVAARMASGGVAGRVQVTADSWRRLAGAFDAEPRGTVEVKGKGPMKTYLLASGLRPDSA